MMMRLVCGECGLIVHMEPARAARWTPICHGRAMLFAGQPKTAWLEGRLEQVDPAGIVPRAETARPRVSRSPSLKLG